MYRIEPLEDAAACAETLAALDGVENVNVNGRGVFFEYHAEEREAAALLSKLVAAGTLVVAFGPVRATLEDAYLKAGVSQVD